MISDQETERYLAEVLEILRQRFDAGDKAALLLGIRYCLMLKKPLAQWLRSAFLEAYDAATGYEIRSWDKVFGAPHPKGTHLATEKRNLYLRGEVVSRIIELHAAGNVLDKELFETVGRELGIGGTLASDLYYDERGRDLRESES